MSQEFQHVDDLPAEPAKGKLPRTFIEKLRKNSGLIVATLFILFVVFSLARASVYKIRPYERGLHLRGGRFVGIDQPGWHFQIPFVDTVIGLNVSERPGTIDNLAAMTADDVTMDVSLLYTYRVTDPVKFALEVTEPEQIVAGFVKGTLRDLVNTRSMDDVMHGRADINQELMTSLQQKEARYGVEFILVQIQNASPPAEVVSAIKDKMVAKQLQEKAVADAAQAQTLADSEFYTAQKKAEGDAYQITRMAEADAQRIQMSSEAEIAGIRALLAELDGKGALAEQYIQVLIARELSQNSKWIISNGDSLPLIDLTGATAVLEPTSTP
ncbi:membrane protease subunits, stomatin/prohibitin homologs [Longilinea arvoryzae]|uniref:Membrane protease subunits, stomatin/prohibitin homologs n=1 Tax=Longilinea arvoryzae TaxID=360412 RepID=A0A0S7BNC6_9CHLR|nr:SPFH domain-containing protein [Longilinea arvoryzae]GAP15515.1 membrane protease subunits, stomatin/prohibitin homologs [Longilinea arvoryzae]